MIRERLYGWALWATSMSVCALLTWIVFDLARRGSGSLSFEFLTAAPRDAGRAGGIGSLLVDSIFQRDIPVTQGCILVIILVFLMVNLVVDLLYSLIDPRIKYY